LRRNGRSKREEVFSMTNVVIVSAARTAVGSFNGAFANTPAHDLGAAVLEAVVERAGIDKAEVSETILGQVLTAGQGQNPARQAHINAGLPVEAAAWGSTRSAARACARSRWRPSTSSLAMPPSSPPAGRRT
jgi:acetyl-CoA acetyltransferase